MKVLGKNQKRRKKKKKMGMISLLLLLLLMSWLVFIRHFFSCFFFSIGSGGWGIEIFGRLCVA